MAQRKPPNPNAPNPNQSMRVKAPGVSTTGIANPNPAGGASDITQTVFNHPLAGAAATNVRPLPWRNTTATSGGVLPSSPGSLQQIGKDHAQLVESIKNALQQRFQTTGQQEVGMSRFWDAFQQYPAEMSQLVVRRLFTNQVNTQATNVGRWLSWLDKR
jgi:hypothetical protein